MRAQLYDVYYYGIENQIVQDPIPLSAIAARVASGALPEWVILSRYATGPWAPLRLVQQLGDEAFAAPKPKPVQKLADPPARPPATPKPITAPVRQPVEKKQPGTVAGFYEILALVCIVAGAINLGLGVVYAVKGNLLAWPMIGSAVGAFLIALGLTATAEVLKRLLAISEAVRKTAEKE